MLNKKKILIISQVYVPDPAAVGQYLHDVVVEMAKRGWEVVVFTSNRGYDDPTLKYCSSEIINGVKIKRFPLSSFGKNSFGLRLTAAFFFMVQSVLCGLFVPGLSTILVTTSPPMCSLAAVIVSLFRSIPIKYWVMDLNPDQMIALGLLSEKSIPASILNWFNRLILKRAQDIIALDLFMEKRLIDKLDIGIKITVLPPWAHGEHNCQVDVRENTFREKYGLSGKFIFMYSGNHTYTNPVKTFLDTALALQENNIIQFLFIGGGLAKGEIDDAIAKNKPQNLMSLPYQPFEETCYSLAAADVHMVSVGENMTGVVHPSKIYGAMAVGRPVLLLGPEPCYASDIIRKNGIGWHIKHGDVDGAVKTIIEIVETPLDKLKEMGERAKKLANNNYNSDVLLKKFCDIVER